MAEIPTSTGLPRRPIKGKGRERAYNRRPILGSLHLGAQANFFGSLSDMGMGIYRQLKDREKLEQFERAQNDSLQTISNYNQWVRNNPLNPDIELNQFNEMMKQNLENIEKYLTNGEAATEFDDWFTKRKTAWADDAMAITSRIDLGLKESEMHNRANNILSTDMTNLGEEDMRGLQQLYEQNYTSGLAKGLWDADKLDEMNILIKKGQAEIAYKWTKAKLLTMPREEFDIYIRDKSLPITDEQRQSIERQRNFYDKQAENDRKKLQEETFKQMLIDTWDGKLIDADQATRQLEANNLDSQQAKYLRDTILSPKPVDTNLRKYAEVQESIAQLRNGEITKEKALDVLYKNITGINQKTGESLVAKIYSVDDTTDPANDPDSKRILQAFAELKNNNMYHDDEEKNLSLWIEHTNDFEQWLKDNPNATPKQKKEYFDGVVGLVKEEKAKGLLDKWWFKWSGAGVAGRAIRAGYRKYRPEEEPVEKKTLTIDDAKYYLNLANGDRKRAEELAKQDGFEW